MEQFYVTTPIYYVNDQPHIGHIYTTTVADVLARYHRLCGHETFFLTGTDEHATKVVDAAQERGLSTQAWADQNANAFRETFARLGMSNDDFIRTSEQRHIERVEKYVRQLLESGDVYLGEFEGWYDAGQEEYVPEARAKESDYISPINKKPLIRKKETNYFFKLSAYGDALLEALSSGAKFDVAPEGRKNEIVSRIKEGLHDVPISRAAASDWGIPVPESDGHIIYVWIDALMNYLTTIDTDDRRDFWPASCHVVGKDIIWFHAVIWPAMLMALKKCEGNGWIELPQLVYAHSFWIREGEKMSKSMGNFVDLKEIDDYVECFGIDALRLFLATQGPLAASDADFARQKFITTYNTELANTVGNCFSRLTNMVGKYFDGALQAPTEDMPFERPLRDACSLAVAQVDKAMAKMRIDQAATAALELVRQIDGFIQSTEPFKRIKNDGGTEEVKAILYDAVEALRIASLLLWPIAPTKMEELWQRFGLRYADALRDGSATLATWTTWGQMTAGTNLEKGEALFPRFVEPKTES